MALPLAAAMTYLWWQALQEGRAREVSLLQVRLEQVENDIRELWTQSEWVMSRMAKRPAFRALSAAACDDEMAVMREINPAFLAITLWNRQGGLVCSSYPLRPDKPAPEPHRKSFDAGLATDGLYLSDLFQGQITGLNLVTFTYPVKDGSGATTGLLSIPVRAETFEKFLQTVVRGPGSTAGITDRKLVLVARIPVDERWRGKSIAGVVSASKDAPVPMNVLVSGGIDGVKRIVARKTLDDIGWRVFVSVEEEVLFAGYRRQLMQGILMFAFVVAFSLALGVIIARSISRPLRHLVSVADSVAKGDYKARAVVPAGGEIAMVANHINRMLDALESSDTSQRRSAARLSTTLESITDAFFTLDREWRFAYINGEAERQLQRTRAELLGKVIWEEFEGLEGTPSDIGYREAMRSMQAQEIEQFYPPLGKWFEARVYPSEEGLAVYFRDISGRKQAEKLLRASMARSRDLSARLLIAEEDERKRIAYDLHDQVGQELTALKIRLETAARITDSPAWRAQALEAAAAAGETLQRVRQMSVDLRPPQLDALGLSAALRGLVERQSLGKTALHFNSRDFPVRLPADLEIVCFRVVQAALTNVLRHSGAANAWVDLSAGDGVVRVSVRDDGAGFDAGKLLQPASGGLGLLGMQERCSFAGGTLDIRSQPGQGCTVTATFPIPAAA